MDELQQEINTSLQPQNENNVYSVNNGNPDEDNKIQLLPTKGPKRKCIRKCLCLSYRECCCCFIGLFISIIICVSGLLIFVLLSANSVQPDIIGPPSNIIFNNTIDTNSTSIGADYIYLKWFKPDRTGGSYIISYTLQFRMHSVNNSNNFTSIFMVDNGLENNHNVTNLFGSTMYDFRITSNNLAGFSGNWSDIYSVKTKKASLPYPPQSPFPMNISQTKDLIKFTLGFEPTSNGGSSILLYTIYYGLNSNNSHDPIYKPFCNITSSEILLLNEYNYPNCSGNINTAQLSLLHYFIVQSTNIIGNSTYSKYTPCIIPNENIHLYMCSMTYPPSNIDNSSFKISLSSFEIDIKWLPPGCKQYSPILSYQLQKTDWWFNEPLTNMTLVNNGLELYAQINNLMAGITYHIRIRAINEYGGGEWSNLEVTTPEAGGCGNYYDTNILKLNCKKIQTQMPSVWINCDGKDECQTNEIQSKWGFSDECTSCWVGYNDCAFGVCFQECMHESPSKCAKCMDQKCSGPTETCSGIALIPPDCP